MKKKQLKEVGLKVTVPRLRILEVLESAEERHLSAEDVYKTLMQSNEDVSLATVYRVLMQFEHAGLVTKHYFGNSAVFELDSEEHHDHMVCVDTGDIIEFHSEAIEVAQDTIAKEHGYEIVDHRLILYVRKLQRS